MSPELIALYRFRVAAGYYDDPRVIDRIARKLALTPSLSCVDDPD